MTVYDARTAWSPTYTAYAEYKYVESVFGQLLTLRRIQSENATTTNTNVVDMWVNVLIEQGYTGDVNASANAFTYLFKNCVSSSI